MRARSIFVVLALTVGAIGLVGSPANAATIVVDNDGVECPAPDYNSIQAAVNAASAGDTINVCPGTYAENVTIDKQLTVDGTGPAAAQVVDPPANGPAIAIASNADGTNLVDITASGSTGDAGNVGAGIQLTGTGTVDNITFLRARAVNNQGHGIAINTPNDATTVSNLVLDDVEASDNGGVGFRVPTSLISLTGLTITDSELERNTTGMEMSITTSMTAALQPVSNVLVEDTSFDANRNKGIYTERLSDATLRRISVVGSGTVAAAPTFDAGIDINLKFRAYQNITIEDSVVTDNGSGDPTNGVGIGIKARDDTGHPLYGVRPASLTGVWVTNTDVERNTSDGIRLGEVAPAMNNSGLSNVHINLNNITTNTGAGLNNRTPVLTDGECNFWGSPSGPAAASNPGGTGDEVSTNVDYTPWLTARAPGGACNGPIVTPPNKDACKKDGWMAYTDGSGRPFKNQGDCQSYFATGGKNEANG